MDAVLGIFGGQLGVGEILVIAAVGLLLFGSRLPQVGRSLGRAIVQFKKGLHEVEDEIEKAGEEGEKTGDEPPDLPAPERGDSSGSSLAG